MGKTLTEPGTASKQEQRRPENPLRICFVCTGNTCRSPMAAAVANFLSRQLLDALPDAVKESVPPPTVAFSAGLYAVTGEPISAYAALSLEEAGIVPTAEQDYRKHSAHTLSHEEAQGYDLLVGMTSSHTMELFLRFPDLATRITCLPVEISDPYGGSAEVYRQCLAQIIQGVKQLLLRERDGIGNA